jgi:hypothetical protein
MAIEGHGQAAMTRKPSRMNDTFHSSNFCRIEDVKLKVVLHKSAMEPQ